MNLLTREPSQLILDPPHCGCDRWQEPGCCAHRCPRNALEWHCSECRDAMPGIAASIHWRPSPCPWPNQSCKRWHRANMYEMGRLHALALDAFHREIACKIRRKLRRETLHVDEKEEDIASPCSCWRLLPNQIPAHHVVMLGCSCLPRRCRRNPSYPTCPGTRRTMSSGMTPVPHSDTRVGNLFGHQVPCVQSQAFRIWRLGHLLLQLWHTIPYHDIYPSSSRPARQRRALSDACWTHSGVSLLH